MFPKLDQQTVKAIALIFYFKLFFEMNAYDYSDNNNFNT